jgi:hypothetical protein
VARERAGLRRLVGLAAFARVARGNATSRAFIARTTVAGIGRQAQAAA